MLLKVGALAKRTGLTIRTLHHYDEIGLLLPSHRSEAGYRMYNLDDLARLHQIQALKQLGFALADIGETLASDGAALGDIITQQLAALERQAAQTARLRAQLLRLKAKMDRGDEPEMADWLITLELMTMYDKYFTTEELKSLDKYRQSASSNLDTRWPELVTAMRDLMDHGIAPAHADAQARVAEWTALVQETVGNDPGLLIKLDAMTRNEAVVQVQTGIDPELLGFVMACMQARHAAIYAKYLTPQELERVMQGRAKTGPQWPPLIAAMRKLIEQGAGVTDPEVLDLAAQWKALFDITHDGAGGGLAAKLGEAYAQEPELLRGTGLDLAMLAFVGRAMASL
jgi:MerR family transcriptional regulator, thiopeptide resistance regulator